MSVSTPSSNSYIYHQEKVPQTFWGKVCQAQASKEESSGDLVTKSRIPWILATWNRALLFQGGDQRVYMGTRPNSSPDRFEPAQRNPHTERANAGSIGLGSQPLKNSQDESGSPGQDPTPDPDSDWDPDPEESPAPQKGRWVYLKPSRFSDPRPLDVLGWHDVQFCDELRATYRACRSYLRKYLSIMRFHHWGFDKVSYWLWLFPANPCKSLSFSTSARKLI